MAPPLLEDGKKNRRGSPSPRNTAAVAPEFPLELFSPNSDSFIFSPQKINSTTNEEERCRGPGFGFRHGADLPWSAQAFNEAVADKAGAQTAVEADVLQAVGYVCVVCEVQVIGVQRVVVDIQPGGVGQSGQEIREVQRDISPAHVDRRVG